MLTEKYYGNFYVNPGSSGGVTPVEPDEPSEPETLEPGTVVVPQTEVLFEEDNKTGLITGSVEANKAIGMALYAMSESAIQLEVIFDGVQYILPKLKGKTILDIAYGEIDTETGDPSFSKYPIFLSIEDNWIFGVIIDDVAGTHTISVKIPDSKGTPKIIRITKAPRTVLNQLCRVSKALKSQNQTDNNTQKLEFTPTEPLTPVGPGDGTLD